MGRTSDTRMYNPRSESSEMFRANHEDERPPSGVEDAKDKEKRKDKKQAKREREEKEDNKIRHIKVRRHHLGIDDEKPDEPVEEEEEKFKPRGSTDNPANQTMPSGAGGFLTSLAMGAKGPGAAGGQMVQMSEPMKVANQLLKETRFENRYGEEGPGEYDLQPHKRGKYPFDYTIEGVKCRECGEISDDPVDMSQDGLCLNCKMKNTSGPKHASEPMDIAWRLLKSDTIKKKESKRSVKQRRKKEGYAKWRPSTGQFEKPKGGGDPRNITSRRSKNISRNLPMGRKTGLNRSHFSVEYSHRGLASKQPPSKDPQQYRPYLASQDARKLLGGVRTVYTPHMRHSQRSYIAGDTGGGRLTNTLQYPRVPRPRLRPVRAPSIVPPQLKRPHLARPKMPSMITMSEDIPQHSDILKANAYQAALMRIALKEIRELMREKKDKDSKKKGKGEPDTAGAASTLPNYPANSPKQTNRNQGGTEDVNNEPRDFGLDPGALVGRGSGRV